MKDLHQNVVSQYAVYWDKLGLQLGLKDYDIANISENKACHPRRVELCCTAVLQKWLDSDKSASWGKLSDAIMSIKSLIITPVHTTSSNSTGSYLAYSGIISYIGLTYAS